MAQKFTARPMLDGANVWRDDDEWFGSFATLAAAQAVADMLNRILALPFAEIGTPTKGDAAEFGRERVAHFVAKALGFGIAKPD
jgi:hypothetical protein